MQTYIIKSKNQITLIGGILIAFAFISKWTVGNMEIFKWALILAAIIGDRKSVV